MGKGHNRAAEEPIAGVTEGTQQPAATLELSITAEAEIVEHLQGSSWAAST